MTIELFMFLFTIGSAVSSLLTQALKQTVQNIASNVVALFSSFAVGGLGTIFAYILMDVPFNPKNIVCIVLMVVCMFIGSTVGYDKVRQTLEQVKG